MSINIEETIGSELMAALETVLVQGHRWGIYLRNDRELDDIVKVDDQGHLQRDVARFRGHQALIAAALRHPGEFPEPEGTRLDGPIVLEMDPSLGDGETPR